MAPVEDRVSDVTARLVSATGGAPKVAFYETLDCDAWLIEICRAYLYVSVGNHLDVTGWAVALGLADWDDYRKILAGPCLERVALVEVSRVGLTKSGQRAVEELSATTQYARWLKTSSITKIFSPKVGRVAQASTSVSGPIGRRIEAERLASMLSVHQWVKRIGISSKHYHELLRDEQYDLGAAKELKTYADAMRGYFPARLWEAYQKARESKVCGWGEVHAAEETLLALVERRRRDLAPDLTVPIEKPKLKADQVWVDFTEGTDAADDL
jgi:hypothetical protein